jgi:hypothetical protein
MARKTVVFGIVILLVGCIGLIASAQKKPMDHPPAVPEEMWIPLTDNSGIALNWTGELPDGSRDPALIYGTLMVKTHGTWQKAYLESVPLKGRFMPIK